MPVLGAQALERLDVAVHERLQLVHVRVLAAHLADLRAHRDGDALGLTIADEPGQLGGALVVDALLLGKRGLGQVHERRGIDIDVVEAGVQLLFDERAQRLQLGLGFGGVLLGVHLHVVALDEQRPGEAFAQRRGGHHRHVLRGTLLRVADLRAGDLADERAHVEPLGGAEHGARGVVGEHADVHGRRGKRGDLAPTARHVELVDRRRPHARVLPDLPDQPARLLTLAGRTEHRPAHQLVHCRALTHGRTLEPSQRRLR